MCVCVSTLIIYLIVRRLLSEHTNLPVVAQRPLTHYSVCIFVTISPIIPILKVGHFIDRIKVHVMFDDDIFDDYIVIVWTFLYLPRVIWMPLIRSFVYYFVTIVWIIFIFDLDRFIYPINVCVKFVDDICNDCGVIAISTPMTPFFCTNARQFVSSFPFSNFIIYLTQSMFQRWRYP